MTTLEIPRQSQASCPSGFHTVQNCGIIGGNMHTPGPWWNESGVIHARARTWTPDCHVSFHVARVDLARDDGIDNAQLIATSPELLEALQEISKVAIDIGLDVTPAESPSRDLVICIYHLATDAAMKARSKETR